MIYTLYEGSVDRGAPVECYKFIGSARIYWYTTADHEIVLNGERYFPVASTRSNLRVSADSENELNLELKIDAVAQVVKDYAYSQAAPQSLFCEVYRAHIGSDFSKDFVLIWKGNVASINITERMAFVLIPSSFSRAMQSEVPNVYYQNSCNHVLYDNRCKVNRAFFSSETTVTQTGSLAVTVASSAFGDGVLAAGEIIVDRTKERRGIIKNVGTTISIAYPFSDIVTGDKVTLVAGCDHSFSTCQSKFGNSANYGGFPSIPSDNPFIGNVK